MLFRSQLLNFAHFSLSICRYWKCIWGPKKEPEPELVGILTIFKRFQMNWIMKQNQCILSIPDFQTVSNGIPTGIFRLMGYLKPFENRYTQNALVLLHNPIHLKPLENHQNPHQFGFGFLFGPLSLSVHDQPLRNDF